MQVLQNRLEKKKIVILIKLGTIKQPPGLFPLKSHCKTNNLVSCKYVLFNSKIWYINLTIEYETNFHFECRSKRVFLQIYWVLPLLLHHKNKILVFKKCRYNPSDNNL
jgi:hypothetical protein